jgi:glycosyltransferase involved in cell wall biosynthesis
VTAHDDWSGPRNEHCAEVTADPAVSSGVSIVIASYGDSAWQELAWTRAYPSTLTQEGVYEVIVHHEPDGDVASCRNQAAVDARGRWLVFLDADDELAPGFVTAVERAMSPGRLLNPSVQYVRGGVAQKPVLLPERDLRDMNYLIVGTAVERSLFTAVGGFRLWPHGFEDWDLWCRCVKAGARVARVPDAVYVAHVNDDSKMNARRRTDRTEELRIWNEVRRDLYPDLYP